MIQEESSSLSDTDLRIHNAVLSYLGNTRRAVTSDNKTAEALPLIYTPVKK